jgi:hypothetical protein
MSINNEVHGYFTLGPGQDWYFWFYPHGGAYLPGNQIDGDRTTLKTVARPAVWVDKNTWDIAENGLTVVLELGPNGTYRHSYRFNVRNSAIFSWHDFYVAVAQLQP